MRQAVIYQDEDGAWIAEVPSLPGCVTQGTTREDALKNAAEAAALWIETMQKLGELIPQDRMTASVTDLPIAI